MKVKNEYGHRFVFVPNEGRDLERRVEFPVGETVEISQETYRAMQIEETPRGWFSPDDKGRNRLVVVPEPAPKAPEAAPAGDVRPKK